jgi:hypothetical protein
MNQLKTREEMEEMSVSKLEIYENELYQLWNQAGIIRRHKAELESNRILLNDTSVIDVPLLTEGICEACECEPCACTQVYNEVEE